MTPEEHKERHILLHKHLDELLADFIGHSNLPTGILDRPIKDLLTWSAKQTQKPTEIKES